MVFIGYSDETKGYRLLNSTSGRVIISRDVELLENRPWNWGENTGNSAPVSKAIIVPIEVPIAISTPNEET